MLYVLADHNANVVGLTDDRGRLVGQYAYTPYGEIRAAECFTPDSGSLASAEAVVAAKGNVLGHQGLRTERFDRPWEGALDAATATAAYGQGSHRALNHNRNRMYDPAAGRFIEQDPNALGLPVIAEMVYGGACFKASHIDSEIQSHYGDGMNCHVAYGASPRSRQDANGLNYGLDIGFSVGQMARDLVSQYSLNLVYDLDWAGDFDRDDQGHSRLSGDWITVLLVKNAVDMMADSLMGPLAMLRDIVRLGESIGEWLIGDDGGEGADDSDDDGAGPMMAGSSLSGKVRLPRAGPGHSLSAARGTRV